ncbi:hypothetical protein B0H63DRAFT_464717 [Podospora didyma]|uniref:NWD NACHT-NTPase N-terminal domain-containing protein n=1 Tax=Podospora didyma TaxID=330526 RepID=A0AAE0NYQ2_9PEZI|nr:hypothetical protein B0H63DRAFT_464717 [Podospora didyma]
MFKAAPVTGPDTTEKWAQWYQPGRAEDSRIYAKALLKCKEINADLAMDPFGNKRHELRSRSGADNGTGRTVVQQQPYQAAWIAQLVEQEKAEIAAKEASKPDWVQKVQSTAYSILRITSELKPIIDVFVPESPEYSVPYHCLWIVFKGFVARKDKKDSVLDQMASLSEDLHIFEAYRDMFPTDEMKHTLAELYIHTTDLLWRLAKYYSHKFLVQLTDALLPRTKYQFELYQKNVANTASRLKTLCETGHMAEQKSIKSRVEDISSDLRLLSKRLENTRLANSHLQASELIDIWNSDVGDVEHELQMWESLQLATDMRDHWSQNGILRCLLEWRQLCDKSQNSILWICSEGNRQSWMTEFSVDLVRVCRSQGQAITFAFCDRPRGPGARWTPKKLLQQLIAQLLNQNPQIVSLSPAMFSPRTFRRATTFKSVFRLLCEIVAVAESLVIVIDRLDLCVVDPDPVDCQPNMAQALSILVRSFPKSLRVVVSSAKVVGPDALPNLPISFANINTRRRPRRRRNEAMSNSLLRLPRAQRTRRIVARELKESFNRKTPRIVTINLL